MKKINVTTFCLENSYGSVLQAYALKKTLSDIGFASEIITKEKKPAPTLKLNKPSTLHPRDLAKFAARLFAYKQRSRRYTGTMSFINQKMDIRYNCNFSEISFDENNLFLTGSDQVWNLYDFKKEHFLDFVPAHYERLSYAASMGRVEVPPYLEERFKELVQGFKRISVRESDMIPLLRRYTDCPIDVNIDPTLLVSDEHWRSLEKEYPISNPYILVYPLYWNKKYNDELKALHKRTGKDIVVISEYMRPIYANKWICDADIQQFLWLIDHADAVVSTSFHGTIFSLIFNKPLASIINMNAPSRISSLLEILDYKNLKISDLSEIEGKDFSAVRDNIATERSKSICYLQEILK